MNRRYFLQTATASAALRRSANAASDRVNIAVIGVRGRGRSLAASFASVPNTSVECLVDVDERVPAPVANELEKTTGKRPRVVQDLRRVLDDKSIDAVAIATPDHWHAPATILACDAGKDVYVEKPCSHNIREGQLMLAAARRGKRVVQHGTQGRSRPSTQMAIEYAQSGKIGNILMAKAWNVQRRNQIGHKADSPVPAGLDYDTWIGPAVWMPFNENRFHYTWHWHWNFGTGDMGNDGAHQIDQARWALGVDFSSEVSGMGRKLYFDDDQQTPDTMTIMFNYPNKVLMFEMRIWTPYKMEGVDNGFAVYGTDGMLQIGRWGGEGSGFKVFDKAGKLALFEKDSRGDGHAANFIECVRSRAKPNADIELGYISAMHCHLGNIVARTGRTLRLDSKTGSISGDVEASKLVTREYRKHWATPKNF